MLKHPSEGRLSNLVERACAGKNRIRESVGDPIDLRVIYPGNIARLTPRSLIGRRSLPCCEAEDSSPEKGHETKNRTDLRYIRALGRRAALSDRNNTSQRARVYALSNKKMSLLRKPLGSTLPLTPRKFVRPPSLPLPSLSVPLGPYPNHLTAEKCAKLHAIYSVAVNVSARKMRIRKSGGGGGAGRGDRLGLSGGDERGVCSAFLVS